MTECDTTKAIQKSRTTIVLIKFHSVSRKLNVIEPNDLNNVNWIVSIIVVALAFINIPIIASSISLIHATIASSI